MLMSRIYDEADLARYKTDRADAEAKWRKMLQDINVPDSLMETFVKQVCDNVVTLPKMVGIDVIDTGFSQEQNFATSLVTDFVSLGIMELKGKHITLKSSKDKLKYTILREPGRWCLHCGEKLSDDQNGEMARLHIAMNHKGVASPDPNTPSGYEWLTYFECVLDESQHNRYRKGA